MSSEIEVNNEFGGDTGQSDLTLVVEDHKIPVFKTVLCIASPVFRAMLEGDFQEKSKSEIQLPGKSYEDFVEFLRCIYPDKTKKVKDTNAYKLLPLAHEYGVKKMERRCEKVLIKIVKKSHTDNVEELYRHIHMSETYDLEELKKICFYLASEHYLEQFNAARQKYQISDSSHYRIVELALQRRELDKADERYLTLNDETGRDRKFGKNYEVSFIIRGNIEVDQTDVTKCLSAIRLSERFKTTTTETVVRSNLLRKLQNLYSKIEDEGPQRDQFEWLPENIKAALQNN